MKKRPMYKVQVLWDTVIDNCKTKYNTLREVAIDEAMVRYKGFKAVMHKAFMPLKSIRWGFKIYAVAESLSGYIINFMPHELISPAPKIWERTLKVLEPAFGKWHHVFCDKIFTSVNLAKELSSKSTYLTMLTGSINTNRKDLPNSLKRPKKHLKRIHRTRRGTFYTRQNDELVYILWKDSNVMSLLTNFSQGFRDKTADQSRSRHFLVRRFSKDGRSRRQQYKIRACGFCFVVRISLFIHIFSLYIFSHKQKSKSRAKNINFDLFSIVFIFISLKFNFV